MRPADVERLYTRLFDYDEHCWPTLPPVTDEQLFNASWVTHDEAGRSLGGASHITASRGDHEPGTMAVAQVRIDRVIPASRRVSLIQLDVEGFEEEALAGAAGVIARHKPILILETTPRDDWFSEHILALGYRKTRKLGRNTVFAAS